jgi:hypothetical protein
MGHAKTRTAALIQHQPTCTYCGGAAPSVNRDHCPPTAIFDFAQRPPGLEFGACAECHEGTRGIDAVAAFLSRNFPPAETEAGLIEGRKHARTLARRFPHLAAAMHLQRDTTYQGQPAIEVHIDAEGPFRTVSEAFAARVGLALFRNARGEPAPKQAAIFPSFLPNAHLDADETLNELLVAMGMAQTIGQGRWHVAEQFRYWSGTPTDAPYLFCAFAAFRHSFGVLAIIDTTGETWATPAEIGDKPLHPGFLKGFKV